MSDLLTIELRNNISSLIKKIEILNETLTDFQAEMDLATTNTLLTNLQAIISDIGTMESDITTCKTNLDSCKTQLDKLNFNGDNLKTEYV